MKICLVISMHDRSFELSKFYQNYLLLKQEFDLQVVATISDKKCHEQAKTYGFTSKYVKDNKPLGRKRNLAMQLSSKTEARVFFSLADDHLINKEYIQYCVDRIKSNIHFCALLDAYFYDYKQKRAVYHPGYIGWKKGEPHGIAKCYSRSFLEKLNWKVVDDDSVTDMDHSNQKRLMSIPHRRHLFKMKGTGMKAVDLKNGNTLNSIEAFLKREGEEIDVKEIFPQNEFEL